MKVEYKEKAFTLIELLAVIVILAIVALVATPMVLNVINSSRDKANLSSAYGIADAARLYYNQSKFNGEEISEDNLLPILTIGGKKPEVGDVRVNEDGEVTIALNYDNKCYYKGYKTGTITVGEYNESTCLIDGSQTPDICFEFEPDTGTITDYNIDIRECGPYVVIPSQIDGVDVEVIGKRAFNCGIYGVVIPNSVTSIGEWAFSSNNMTSVIIPNSVISIGASAFSYNNFTSVTIPSSVISIGEEAFLGNKLTNLTIPSSVTNIGDGAFSVNNLPPEQALIYARNNDGSEDLTHIVSYGGTVGHFDIPEGVTTIGSYAFSDTNLSSVTMPNSVTSIGNHAFLGNNLTNVTISNSVTSIGEYAFLGNNLTSVTIPSSVASIGENAFLANDYFFSIKADPTKSYNYTNIIGSRYNQGYVDILDINIANTTANCFEFNSSTGTITRYKHWYDNCSNEVVIPTQIDGVNVTSIGNYSFYNSGITNVTISQGINTIGREAFCYSNLANIIIPNSVTSIGSYAFANNNLTSVTIPSSVISIDDGAFNNNNLNENDAYIYARTSLGIDYSTIVSYGGTSKNITIPGIFNNVVLTSIGDYAFWENNLTNVVIPNSVTDIGYSAFCSNNLTSVTIPNSVITIGNDAFSFNNLTSVTIPNSVTGIGENAFQSNKLTSVIISSNVTRIERSTFAWNNLESVTIPNSVTSIGQYAFEDNNIEEVILPSSLTNLGSDAFSSNAITTLTIPSGVTSLSSYAFEYYTWLNDIYINKPENSISGAPWGAPKATVHWQD